MSKSTDLGSVQRSAKKIWRQAADEIEPLQESAAELIAQSAKQVKRATRQARRFIRRNPWTSAGAVALIAAVAVAVTIYIRRQDQVVDGDVV